jgi:hypothetical protein
LLKAADLFRKQNKDWDYQSALEKLQTI